MRVGKHKLPEERYTEKLVGFAPALRKFRGLIAIVLLLVMAGVAGGLLVLHDRTRSSARAWEAVFDLDSAEDVGPAEKVVNGSDAEPAFILKAGHLLFERGTDDDLATAADHYKRLYTDWPEHQAADQARQCHGHVLEQMKEYEKAYDIFESLSRGSGPLAAENMWHAGRCAESMERVDLAEGHYRRLMAEAESSLWARYAGYRLADMLSAKEPGKEGAEGG